MAYIVALVDNLQQGAIKWDEIAIENNHRSKISIQRMWERVKVQGKADYETLKSGGEISVGGDAVDGDGNPVPKTPVSKRKRVPKEDGDPDTPKPTKTPRKRAKKPEPAVNVAETQDQLVKTEEGESEEA